MDLALADLLQSVVIVSIEVIDTLSRTFV